MNPPATGPGPVRIGPHRVDPPLFVAPMAGVTDAPYRRLCRKFGAGLATAEMLTADTGLWHSDKSRLRRVAADEAGPRSVQIVGNDPAQMAGAARAAVAAGAQIIDINLGCPAKKVCRKAAGSALMREPGLVQRILTAVVAAAGVPVTLKTRTGWSPEQRNGPEIAQLAEDCGIALVAVHGRTRACRFGGMAEYDTIAEIKQRLHIPVIANGDIDSPEKAHAVWRHTGADGLMIGRAAQGRPWLFAGVAAHLRGEAVPAPPEGDAFLALVTGHVEALHAHYGAERGVRIARKHVGWYLQNHRDGGILRQHFNGLVTAAAQREFLLARLAGGWREAPEAA